MTVKKIIHIDMDAFYASVEQRDNPELRGCPVIVGGAPDRRGVVAACSYEARQFGIHSAMPSARAARLCPRAVFLKPRFEVYRSESQRIRAIFFEFTERVEPLSLDEAYLDVTGSPLFDGSAARLAAEIKRRIRNETGLTASAGVSYNKFLAKIASDMDKPDGLYVITPEQGPAFIESLPVRKFHGIGQATEARMKALGIHTGADLKRRSREGLVREFGKAGYHYYSIARGVDERPVNISRTRKSVGSETTLQEDLDDIPSMLEVLGRQAGKVAGLLEKHRLAARTLTVKVKYDNFQQVTRSHSRAEAYRRLEQMLPVLPELLARTEAGNKKVRLLGVTASNLETVAAEDAEQLDWL
ncbi:MAG: DNA polymerase IV [Gammaproteobacteria bacterium]